MNIPTNALCMVHDAQRCPRFVLLPIEQYYALIHQTELGIPADVAENVLIKNQSPTRVWRISLQFTRAVVAKKMSFTQRAYAQLEARKTIRKSSHIKVAKALNIDESQLDF